MLSMPMFKLTNEVTIFGISLIEIVARGFGGVLTLNATKSLPLPLMIIPPLMVFFGSMRFYQFCKRTFPGYSAVYLMQWLFHPSVWTPGRDTLSIPLSVGSPGRGTGKSSGVSKKQTAINATLNQTRIESTQLGTTRAQQGQSKRAQGKS